MKNNTNFDQQLNVELNKRLGINTSELDSGLSPDEFASVAPLLNLAEKLKSTPTPQLSISARTRIEAQLQNYIVAHPVQPTRIHRLPHWQLLVAGITLILGLGIAFNLFNGADDTSVQITEIAHSANEMGFIDTPTISTSTAFITPDGTVAQLGTVPSVTIPTPQLDDNYPLVTPPETRTIEMAVESDIVACENGVGYWKNNPSAWTMTSLTIGNQIYDQAELLEILETTPTDDASLLLARALIVAYLNGHAPEELGDANALLQDFTGKLPFAVDVTGSVGRMMINTANTLQPTISDCVTVTPIDFNSAAPDSNGSGNGNSTPDTCKNPPPDHANAQGWRERCENGGGNGNGNNGNGNNK